MNRHSKCPKLDFQSIIWFLHIQIIVILDSAPLIIVILDSAPLLSFSFIQHLMVFFVCFGFLYMFIAIVFRIYILSLPLHIYSFLTNLLINNFKCSYYFALFFQYKFSTQWHGTQHTGTHWHYLHTSYFYLFYVKSTAISWWVCRKLWCKS